MGRRSAQFVQPLLLACLRFALLALQVGAAVGLAAMFLMCLGGCGGYGEVIYGAGIAVLAALVAFVGLMVHYVHHSHNDPAPLARQARLQWIWLGVSAFLLVLFV